MSTYAGSFSSPIDEAVGCIAPRRDVKKRHIAPRTDPSLRRKHWVFGRRVEDGSLIDNSPPKRNRKRTYANFKPDRALQRAVGFVSYVEETETRSNHLNQTGRFLTTWMRVHSASNDHEGVNVLPLPVYVILKAAPAESWLNHQAELG
eukprot:357833-Chlamydomonas_euryale.AAC.3